MRFLVDKSTGPAVAQWLHEQGHDVFSVYNSARGLDDDAIVEKAFKRKLDIDHKRQGFWRSGLS